ncbi:MAG: hypothetical protein ACR2LI_13105 [Propionibacteriaceae bacterium]
MPRSPRTPARLLVLTVSLGLAATGVITPVGVPLASAVPVQAAPAAAT